FDAYLVGGCVRDLLLKRTPKDFDVITTANLNQIRKQFHRAQIVGQRFPICIVHIRGSVTEVSSFETVAKHAEEKEELHSSQAPHGCAKKDFILWRNSLKRDFTINSLFFDPFSNKIYDYANGIADLRSLKLRTLIPAKVSFQEDCARILRGLRIAARLGLSFSKDTATAIHSLSSSLMTMAKSRIMLELNYMLSYGAAEPSLCLLQRFNLLKIFLPFQAAYLVQQASTRSDQNPVMLMKLFFNLDKLVSCDRPTDCRLWVGLLGFHLALANNPQDALVVLAFASILYHGEWKEGIRFAIENAKVQVNFVPELSKSFTSKSDEELAKEVSQLATLVQDSLDVLTETESLLEAMSGYPPCSGLVFIPKKTAKDVAELFQLLVKNIGSYEKRRECFVIDYHLLGKGYLWETRFVLGKVILETMRCGTLQRGGENVGEENNCIHTEISEETLSLELSDVLEQQMQVKKDRKHSVSLCSPEVKEQSTKKRKLVVSRRSISERDMTLEKQGMVERGMCQKRAKKHQNIDGTDELAREGLISLLGDMSEKRCQLPDGKAIEKKKGDVKNKKRQQKDRRPSMVVEKKHQMLQEHKVPEQHDAVGTKTEAKLEQVGKETGRRLLLSDLFK
ncbi:Poly A polymerase, partial [Parasponia andersonii]